MKMKANYEEIQLIKRTPILWEWSNWCVCRHLHNPSEYLACLVATLNPLLKYTFIITSWKFLEYVPISVWGISQNIGLAVSYNYHNILASWSNNGEREAWVSESMSTVCFTNNGIYTVFTELTPYLSCDPPQHLATTLDVYIRCVATWHIHVMSWTVSIINVDLYRIYRTTSN